MTPKIPPRRPDWGARLSSYIAASMRRPFAWGSHDCVMFAAGAVEAMTGHDPAATHRGKYSTPKGAAGVLKRAKAKTPADLAAALLPEIPVALVGIGDVVAVSQDDGEALGIFQGAGAYAPGPQGVGILPAHRITRAFKV